MSVYLLWIFIRISCIKMCNINHCTFVIQKTKFEGGAWMDFWLTSCSYAPAEACADYCIVPILNRSWCLTLAAFTMSNCSVKTKVKVDLWHQSYEWNEDSRRHTASNVVDYFQHNSSGRPVAIICIFWLAGVPPAPLCTRLLWMETGFRGSWTTRFGVGGSMLLAWDECTFPVCSVNCDSAAPRDYRAAE